MNTQQSNGFADISNVVAVDQHVPTAGAIVWWRLSGEVDVDTLAAAWAAAGGEESALPHSPSPVVALRRAVDTLRARRQLVRPLGRGAGFAIVKEREVEDARELDYTVLITIKLNEIGRVIVEGMPNASPEFVVRAKREVEQAFEHHLATLDTTDFSSWLVRLMPKVDAVSLRAQGGIYFVPQHAVERVRMVAQVLRQVSSHVVNRVPAMHGDDAVAAILDAITEEADDEAARMERDIAEERCGEKGFESRITQCDNVQSKVARYEELLGQKLDHVRKRLDALKARLSLAALKAQSESGGAGANPLAAFAGL